MSLRQNIANAVRQSSLANSSRMGELLDRFERGMPCGTPDDIDFLIDEIVKRIEERLLYRIAQLPDFPTVCRPDEKDEKDDGVWPLPKRPRPVLTEATLRHEARLLVDQVLRIVSRRFVAKSKRASARKSKQPESTYHRSGKPAVTHGVDEKTRDHRLLTYAKKKTPTRKQQAYQQLTYGNGESMRTATAYALRKAAKSSLRRYSVTGNVKALMCAGEWAKSEDVRALPLPESQSVVAPFQKEVEMVLGAYTDAAEDRGLYRKISPDDEVPFALPAPSKESPKTRAINQFLNSSYTYARRAEIKKALPKFLTSHSREAMMSMFNAIRVAMAEEEVESLDYAGLVAALIDRSYEDSPSSIPAPRSKAITIQPCAKEPLPVVKPVAKAQDRYVTECSRKEMSKSLDEATRDRLSTRQQNFGTLGTYTLRKATRSCLSHLVRRGSSYRALLMMTCNLKAGQTEEEFWQDALDMDMDEATRKEVISDLVELSRQVRAETAPLKNSNGSNHSRTFTEAFERGATESESVDIDEERVRKSTCSPQPTFQPRVQSTVRYAAGVGPHSDTNYTYGIHRGLRRMLPKFTGGRPHSALMHYADHMIADVHQEMVRTGQLVPVIEKASAAKDKPQQFDQRKAVRVSVRDIDTTPASVAVSAERHSVSTQTNKVVVKPNTTEDVFHDAYSWVVQTASDEYYTPSDEAPQQSPPYTKREEQPEPEDDMLYLPARDTVGDEKALSPADLLPQSEVTETWIEIAPIDDEDHTPTSKRSVRFVDGIKPGDASSDDNGENGSAFFKKLGYYERVGSGELLHQAAQRPKRKSRSTDAEAPQATSAFEITEEPPVNRSQEDEEERPLSEGEPQPTTAPLCNCL